MRVKELKKKRPSNMFNKVKEKGQKQNNKISRYIKKELPHPVQHCQRKVSLGPACRVFQFLALTLRCLLWHAWSASRVQYIP